MLNSIYRWLENLWNLRKIFDKYLPQIRELVETVKKLQRQISELRELKTELENGILLLKQTNKEEDNIEDTEELSPIPQQDDGFKITKVNRYYDPEYSVEYFDIEINGDKPVEKDK